MSQLNTSILMLFEPDGIAQELDNLRRHIFSEFGGPSAITLPLHITLLKWRSSPSPQSLGEKLLNWPPQIDVQIGPSIFSLRHRAVWFSVSSPQFPHLMNRIDTALDELAIKGPRQVPVPHITIAYRDYAPDTLRRIYAEVLSFQIGKGALRSSALAVARLGKDQKWRLC